MQAAQAAQHRKKTLCRTVVQWVAILLYSNDVYQVNLLHSNFSKNLVVIYSNNPFELAWKLARPQSDRKSMGGPKKRNFQR